MAAVFTGYDPRRENRAGLTANAIKFDIMSLNCAGDIPDTRGIKDLMRRDDQHQMNSCAGFGMTNVLEVCHYNQTHVWRQFNPLWSYRRGQELDGIRGDNGATIYGVTQAAKTKGGLPEHIDNDGKAEYPYKVEYNFAFPRDCYDIAANWTIGYTIELRGFDQILLPSDRSGSSSHRRSMGQLEAQLSRHRYPLCFRWWRTRSCLRRLDHHQRCRPSGRSQQSL